MCPGARTTRTRKLFLPPACLDLAECCTMSPQPWWPPARVRRRRSDATQQTCLERHRLELHLWFEISSSLTGMT